MAWLSAIMGSKEMIFPEVAALLLGYWVREHHVWQAYGWQVPLLMTLAAVLGVAIVRYLPLHLFLQLSVGYLFLAILVSLLRIPLLPALSAVLLPILIHTTTWRYPLAVAILTTIIPIGTWLWRCLHLQEPTQQRDTPTATILQDLIVWGKNYLLLTPLLLVATIGNMPYLIAPPLLVVFLELTKREMKFRQRACTMKMID